MIFKLWLAVTLVLRLATCLQVEILARDKPEPVCIRDFVGTNTLVVVNIKTSGYLGDGQKLQIIVTDTLGNQFAKRNDINKETRVSFTTHDLAAVDICLYNYLDRGRNQRLILSREVELDIESGAAARDWNALQAAEKLKPAEIELKKAEEMANEINDELLYLRRREETMRNTNESTNSRVKWFSILIIFSLIGLGAWQIKYLRHYFKVKHII